MKISSTIENSLDRFEEAWNGPEPPSIADFLHSAESSDQDQLLRELIKIDLEYRWRKVAPIFLEDYGKQVSLLSSDSPMPIELIAEEFRVRRRWGDNPSHASYLARFPDQTLAVSEALVSVDAELMTRSSFAERTMNPMDSSEGIASSPVEANRYTLVIGQQIDDFRLLNELGQGAFARVFLAQQVSMQRLVALKVSDKPSLESPILSQMEHSNIVRVFDERHVGSMHLMYMQYVPGGNLRDIIDRFSQLGSNRWGGGNFLKAIAEKIQSKGESTIRNDSENSLATMDWGTTVAWLGARIADALTHAHRLGVRHRDIKPENILLAASGQPMLADFNLSFGATLQGDSAASAFGGSLAYMSPEHIQVLIRESTVDSVNEASDIYSLGAVLFELLTGRRPFEPNASNRNSRWNLLDHLLARERGPSGNPSIHDNDQGLYAFILACLAFNPTERPSSARQVARQFQLLSNRSISDLKSPTAKSWAVRWSKHPIAWYLGLGMIPNGLLSPLNIWANHRIAIENFDKDFFLDVELPAVNLIAFPTGILVAWWLAVPISKGLKLIRAGTRLNEGTRSRVARRSLSLPLIVAMIVFFLWSVSGLVFPWWNQWASGSSISLHDFIGFLLSQVLHGLIAACLSLVAVSLVSLQSIYPRLVPIDANQDEHDRLQALDRQLAWANLGLEMTPLFAILAIALSDQFDKLVFVALAVVGFIGHLVAAMLIPKIRLLIKKLQWMLRPTDELLGEGTKRTY